MKSNRWHQVEQIFHQAIQRQPEQRAAFLAQTCAGDQTLLNEVNSLLNSFGEDDSFFEASASTLAAEMFGSLVGETIGPYEVLSELGSGGMGTVYLAQDARLGRKIALKLLPPQFTNDKDRLRRFQQEARAASALNHPNILTVYEIEQKADIHYIATEYVDGVTLRQLLSTDQLELHRILSIATQIASALQAAHAAGIVHRDIKPENVMIRSDGYIKVLDFGLAKLTENEFAPTTSETNPGVVMGTPRYMSPEQARGLDVDLRTDIFSLGTVIYEMVTGRVPFEGETTSDIIAAIIKDEPEPMSLSVPELPSEFEEVVNKALAKDLGLRYPTIADFGSDLQRLKDGIQLNALARFTSDASTKRQTATRLGSTDPQAQQNTDPLSIKASTRWAISAALGLVVLIAVVTVVSLNRRGKPAPAPSANNRQNTRQLTNRDGFISASRFAPDGKGVIYSAGFDGKPLELFFTDAEGSDSRSAGIQSAALKSVSRTGKIAVLFDFELNWSDGFNGTLAILPADGGKPEVLMQGVDDAAFAPDGNNLAIVRSVLGEQQLEYPSGHLLYKSDGWMSYPRFSPKGDKIAFFEHPLGDFSGSLVVFDLGAQKKIDISTGWVSLKGLAWNPKTDEIWFGGSRVGKKLSINAVSLSGQLRTNLYDVPVIGARIDDISDDGTMLINQGSNHATMMVVEDKSAKEVESQFAWTTSADLSADGKTLLYYEWGWENTSGASEGNSVYLRKLDSNERIHLGPGKALALSPDGNWALALQSTPQPQLVLLSTLGAQAKALPNRGIKEYHYASFFPDGRQILFTGVEARKDAAIRSFVQDVNTGEVHPLTEEWTTARRVSPDGKSIITLQPDRTYYIQPLIGGEATPIPGLESGDEPIQWSDDGSAVYVIGPGEFATKIYRVTLNNGARREWEDIDPPNKVGLVGLETNPGGILITPDGKMSVYTYWILLQHLLSKPID
ncbi:MAG TPA: WD40 repeat domain-containing serine/threonine protein kinase [Pyrinomonadaceae bacterium]|jgi:serine/threonine protein kinase|nr:WD40 repeat domain-containing serine/threonine protein kinase [Pyrinomonadaceae bacterium]